MWPVFQSNHWGSHILSSWMGHAGCVFVAGIHSSRTWMSGSFESVRWNACVHRLDLSLYSHPKEIWGNGVGTHTNSKEKNPYQRLRASRRTASPTHYRPSYSHPVSDYKNNPAPPSMTWDARHGPVWWRPTGSFGDRLRQWQTADFALLTGVKI